MTYYYYFELKLCKIMYSYFFSVCCQYMYSLYLECIFLPTFKDLRKNLNFHISLIKNKGCI